MTMKKELPKVYEPREVEGKIYQAWMEAGCFRAAPNPQKKPFTIVMPASSTWATPWTTPSRTC